MDFGALLSEARRDRSLSRAKLAALSGVTYAYVRQLETGERASPRTDKLRSLAAALGLSVDELLAYDARAKPAHEPSTDERQRLQHEIAVACAAMSTAQLRAARDEVLTMSLSTQEARTPAH